MSHQQTEPLAIAELKVAVVMVNLGTPEKATPSAVRQFLRRFLSDQRVVSIPKIVWQPLLNLVILPLRAKRVAKLYGQIWMDKGSPLKVISEQLRDKVASKVTPQCEVYLAMNYSQPDLEHVLDRVLKEGHQRVLLLPMYPQFSSTTTAAVYDGYQKALAKQFYLPELRTINDYYHEPLYITALCNSIEQHWQLHGRSEKLVFSFHGIPERVAHKGDPYPQHCEATAHQVAKQLGLGIDQWCMSYQSRFGKEKWLQPYCDALLTELAEKGIESVDVISPAFATECLETIEEVADELREVFLEAGGKQYSYIPALNDNQDHVELYAHLIRKHSQDW
ncbi:ferrochelatase [Alginatibacterium sediminis]|uniref:Ferrochelatase n=1 Tax=Alginatibacterium sediminis TaxID=2164068 RepID=A0A420EIC1_9ALTE|nr:ferrochelatase [Alginatibacterium sediminis]RKF20435.1 ferrochelatase [Alginatibacterium sediminis]